MIRVSAEQFHRQWSQPQYSQPLANCYLIIGNEPLQIQESVELICHAAKKQQFHEQQRILLEPQQNNWSALIDYCQSYSLFSEKKLLILTVAEQTSSQMLTEKMQQLTPLINNDLLLVLLLSKLSKAQENSVWFQSIAKNAVYIGCQQPDHKQLPHWIVQRAKRWQLTLDPPSVQTLAYYYEGNLLALSQLIETLSLLYPKGNITLTRLDQLVSDMAIFTPYHWIDAMLAGKLTRCLHILQQLQHGGIEILILVRLLQKELLLLLNLSKNQQQSLKQRFDCYKVWQNRRPLLTATLQRISFTQLQQALSQLFAIELALKQDFTTMVWPQLETLSTLICGKNSNYAE